jgi:hypothetical protein
MSLCHIGARRIITANAEPCRWSCLSTFPMENCCPESEYTKSVLQQMSTLPASLLKASLSNSPPRPKDFMWGVAFIFTLTARRIIKPPPSPKAPPGWLPSLVPPCKAEAARGCLFTLYIPAIDPLSGPRFFPIHSSTLILRLPQRTSGWPHTRLRTSLKWTSLKRLPKTCLPRPVQRSRQSATCPTILTKAFLVCHQRMEERPHGFFWLPHS